MAVVINGSGTVTGLAVGGLPDGTVDAGTLADDAVGLAQMASGTDGNLITYDASGNPAAVAVGTSGQVLTSNGAGAAPTMQAGGLYESVAIIVDQKANNTHAGTFTSGAWRTRDLNTEISDPDGIVSLSSNQFTLQAGTYVISWSAPAFNVDRHSTRLYNVTDSSVEQSGVSASNVSGGSMTTHNFGIDRVTIASAKAFRIEHRAQTTMGTYGLGLSMGSNFSVTHEIYCQVIIHKET